MLRAPGAYEKIQEAALLARDIDRPTPLEVPFKLVREAGGLLIGTARTKQRHRPHPHYRMTEDGLRPIAPKPDGTAGRVLLATGSHVRAILGAVAGDINVPGQREHLGQALPECPFDLNEVKWVSENDQRIALVPPYVQKAAEATANDPIGCIDVVWRDTQNGQFDAVGDEVYAVAASRVRVGSLPVFGYNVLELINQGAVEVIAPQS